MTEHSFKGIENIPASGRSHDAINNRENTVNHFDKMTSYFQSIKEKNNKIEKDEFLGYVLFSHLIKIGSFEKIYDQSSTFFKELMNASGKTSPRKDASIIQYRVHVPELTGMLPFPNFQDYARAMRIEEEAYDLDTLNPEEKKKSDKMLKEVEELKKNFFPEILKLDLFPKFYQYTEGGSAAGPLPGIFCKVKLTNSLPTKGVGIVLEVFDEAVETLGLEANL